MGYLELFCWILSWNLSASTSFELDEICAVSITYLDSGLSVLELNWKVWPMVPRIGKSSWNLRSIDILGYLCERGACVYVWKKVKATSKISESLFTRMCFDLIFHYPIIQSSVYFHKVSENTWRYLSNLMNWIFLYHLHRRCQYKKWGCTCVFNKHLCATSFFI